MQPILYSFRRCPYAMRARLAVYHAGPIVELREVVLKNKPPELIAASAKATVPVLVLGEQVIDESLDIMQWSLSQNDPQRWLEGIDGEISQHQLVRANDVEFKPILDKYKYFDRHPELSQEQYLMQAKPYLKTLDNLIQSHGGFLLSNKFGAIDAAIFPFIRQFAHVNLARFQQLDYPFLKSWLQSCLDSQLFADVMKKYPAWSSTESNSVQFGH